jgi:hypothetical protein
MIQDQFETRVFAIVQEARERPLAIVDLLGVMGPVIPVADIPARLHGLELYTRIACPPGALNRPFDVAVHIVDADGSDIVEPFTQTEAIDAPPDMEHLSEAVKVFSIPLTGLAVPSPFLYFQLSVDGKRLATLAVQFIIGDDVGDQGDGAGRRTS